MCEARVGSGLEQKHLEFQFQQLAGHRISVYADGVSTVAEIKDAVSKLPARQKLALARWLQSQTDDRLTDEEMMKIAAEGARALDRREARYAKRKAG